MSLDILNKEIATNIELINKATLARLNTMADHIEYIRIHKETIEKQSKKIELLEDQLTQVSWRGMFKELTDVHLKLIITVLCFGLLSIGIYSGLSIDSIAGIVKAIKC